MAHKGHRDHGSRRHERVVARETECTIFLHHHWIAFGNGTAIFLGSVAEKLTVRDSYTPSLSESDVWQQFWQVGNRKRMTVLAIELTKNLPKILPNS